MAATKLDKDGFIFPLAIGALALMFFAYFFITASNKNTVKPIGGVEDLNSVSKDLDNQNPDSFMTDLNSNTVDAKGF